MQEHHVVGSGQRAGRACRTLLVASLLIVAGAPAWAQTLSLLPADPAQWDVAAHTGWLGGNRSGVGAEWDDWSDTWSGGASVGHYVTPHLKAEIQTTFARRARLQGVQFLVLPTTPAFPFPTYQYQEHFFTTTSVGGGINYQFRENQWFHPYVGAGVDVIHERHLVQVPPQVFPGRDPGAPLVVPAVPSTDTGSWVARPFASAGFKLYLSERAFMRSALRSSFSNRGVAYVTWSAGIGVDL